MESDRTAVAKTVCLARLRGPPQEERCQNIENNPMQRSRWRPAFEQALDTSGNSGALFQYSEILQTTLAPQAGEVGCAVRPLPPGIMWFGATP